MNCCNDPICKKASVDFLSSYHVMNINIIDQSQVCDKAKSELLKQLAHMMCVVAHGLDQNTLSEKQLADIDNSLIILAPLDLAPDIKVLIKQYKKRH